MITDLDPDQRVKNAMNEINSSKRLKYAVAERAEGDKILQVKSAEAGAEALYLSGVGVSRQRKAIVDGLRERYVEEQSVIIIRIIQLKLKSVVLFVCVCEFLF